MVGLLDLLSDPSALFVLVTIIGFILIIIAAVPSLSVFILKNSSFTLNKRQSIIVAAIGGVLIVIGLGGIVGLNQYEKAQAQPGISEVSVHPESPVFVPLNGTQLNITVVTGNPDPNFFQKILQEIFGEPEDLKFVFYLVDQGGNGTIHRVGPIPKNYINFKIFPTDAGKKLIRVDAIEPSEKGENFSWETDYIISMPSNQQPKIENISFLPIGQRMKVVVNATDPEKDTIFYNFTLIPYSKTIPISEIPPRRSYIENSRVLTPGEIGLGSCNCNLEVCIQDGIPKRPWDDHVPVCTEREISI